MNNQEISKLINECRKEMLNIENTFEGSERITTHEKEERFYKTKFEELGVNPKIVSIIYSSRNNNGKIQEIKQNIKDYLN